MVKWTKEQTVQTKLERKLQSTTLDSRKITGVTQLLELDQENSIYSISFCNIVLILYRYENIYI